MRLYHFSDRPGISLFEPRPVATPVDRPGGQEWLNGPLVWAISDAYDFLYLFPRECPRILLWATDATSVSDRAAWLGDADRQVVAYVESRWIETLKNATIHRYEVPPHSFEDVEDVGMWVSKTAVRPLSAVALSDLPGRLRERGVALRALESLSPLKDAWTSTLHVSGIRLRNAIGWEKPV